MRQAPGDSLWLGHAGDARNAVGLHEAGIRAVVDLALNESPAALGRELVYCRFPLVDGGGNPPWLLRAAVDTVASLLGSGTPTLVACGAGMCRALTIAALVLVKLRGCTFAEANTTIAQAGRLDPSPAPLAEVEAAAQCS